MTEKSAGAKPSEPEEKSSGKSDNKITGVQPEKVSDVPKGAR